MAVPLFQPFAGIRYASDDGWLDSVIAPPYDVVSAADRAELASRSPWNAIHLELPEAGPGQVDRYAAAAELWQQWQADGVLAADPEPAFYVYRMGFHDDRGRPRQTAGVIGALALEPPGDGDILPHERTTPKDKADRLDLIRATKANLSPVWGLSMAEGLSALCELPGPPDARCTDDDGVHHRLWRVTQPGLIEAITATVASAPLVVADGHHRLEVALAYAGEQHAEGADGAGSLMALVVELAADQLWVQAVHRLLRGVDPDILRAGLSKPFDLFDTAPADESLLDRMDDAGALALVTKGGTWLLRPTEATESAAEHALDSARLDAALSTLPPVDITFQHGLDRVVNEVKAGRADAAVLLRPATVEQIADAGRRRLRFPPKTTFFQPKPRTGMVFRRVS